jgi:hypothetical protein
MPSGGNTPLEYEEAKLIWLDYVDAQKHGLEFEWLRWFIGGVVNNKLPINEASKAARIEWDF